jgi:NADH dehydrogenase/NADH:ubiquinone oxidoreductase subunit G
MGMSKASLDLQVQQQTQKAIMELQRNQMILDEGLRNIDANMRASHMALVAEITKHSVEQAIRINFIFNEFKDKMTKEEKDGIEQRFKAFAIHERAKIEQKQKEELEKQREEIRKIKEQQKQKEEKKLIAEN